MAHRTQVTQVLSRLEPRVQEKIKDPCCGKEMNPGSSKHVIYRGDKTYYFCSKDCQTEFIRPRRSAAA